MVYAADVSDKRSATATEASSIQLTVLVLRSTYRCFDVVLCTRPYLQSPTVACAHHIFQHSQKFWHHLSNFRIALRLLQQFNSHTSFVPNHILFYIENAFPVFTEHSFYFANASSMLQPFAGVSE